MSDRFVVLAALDAAAKAMEAERCFRLRLLRKLEGGTHPVFRRGPPAMPKDEAERQAYFDRTRTDPEPPTWTVAVPELERLAELILERVPDEQRTLVFLLELNWGGWSLRYGPYLCFSEDGDELTELVERTTASILERPEWPTADDVGQRIELM